MELPKAVLKALEMIEMKGFEAYVVGGCVRDALMGVPAKDYDITTSATPEEVKVIFTGFPVIETGIQHGTVTVLMETFSEEILTCAKMNMQEEHVTVLESLLKEADVNAKSNPSPALMNESPQKTDKIPIEITTYRVDGDYTDRRRPNHVVFTQSITEDLARRDFTINAIAYSDKEGIIDPFNGRDDLKIGKIRCVGNPGRRFQEDALRILRAVRFAAVLGFQIEPETHKAIMESKNTIHAVAMERITSEFSKMICGRYIENVLLGFSELIAEFIPEIKPAIGFNQQNSYHIYDVYTHTAKAVAGTPPSLPVRLAAFFHDIGKPETFSIDENGLGHFYGHAGRSVIIAKTILERMKFDNETKKRVLDLISYHDVQIACAKKSIKHVLNRFSEDFFTDLISLKKADVLSQNPSLKDRIAELDCLLEMCHEIIRENACFSRKDLAINGRSLIMIGIPTGTQIKDVLNDCLNQVIEEHLQNNEEELIRYVEQKYLPDLLKD